MKFQGRSPKFKDKFIFKDFSRKTQNSRTFQGLWEPCKRLKVMFVVFHLLLKVLRVEVKLNVQLRIYETFSPLKSFIYWEHVFMWPYCHEDSTMNTFTRLYTCGYMFLFFQIARSRNVFQVSCCSSQGKLGTLKTPSCLWHFSLAASEILWTNHLIPKYCRMWHWAATK